MVLHINRRLIENQFKMDYSISHHMYSKGRMLSCFNLKGQIFVCERNKPYMPIKEIVYRLNFPNQTVFYKLQELVMTTAHAVTYIE